MIGALEIGGAHVTAARVEPATASVDLGSRIRIDFDPRGPREELLGAILGAAAAVNTPAVGHWAVASPGPFDYERGIFQILGLAKLEELYDIDLRTELMTTLRLRNPDAVCFLNDANAFLLGEAWAGAARGHARAVGVTLGTGLGSAFLVDDEIVEDGPEVPPGGCLHVVEFRGAPVETVLSARGLLARYQGLGGSAAGAREVAERARSGEPAARETFDGFAADLAEFLAPWIDRFRPSCLVVGGGIARAWDLLGEPLEGLADTVAPAERIDDAPLLGAALHASRR